MRELNKEQISTIRERLKECKPEWLEKNAKGQDSLGVWTVQQILDYATEGTTTWDFDLSEQWREEVNKFNKSSGQWMFDGYVYHVRGKLIIDGIGSRTQYGSKVAIGGKDNQNSSYKSAASDCLKKCASLFGVGSSIYSKIKIDTEESYDPYASNHGAQYQQQQMQMPQIQQQTLPNGDVQQGEWIWSHQQQNWIHQSQYQPNSVAQNFATNMNAQQPVDNVNWQQAQEQYSNQLEGTIQATDQAISQGSIDVPFENVSQQAQPQSYEAQPQSEAQQKDFQANPIQYGAPVDTGNATQEKKQEPDTNIATNVNNPWATEEVKNELKAFQDHKNRLNIKDDPGLLPHVREYFKDGEASLSSITPETLKGFNTYLQNIQA